jgi:hypothetical protein
MKRIATVVIALCLVAGMAAAHGKQMMGTVVKLSDKEITIETKEKETKTLKLTPETTYLKSGNTARLADLKVGERVFIHYKEAGGALEAMEVIFGPQPQKSKAAPAKKG